VSIKFGIVTPTIQRDSLLRCCESVDLQTHSNWQHVVMVDSKPLRAELLDKIQHPLRKIIECPIEHHNGGNTCRHNAWYETDADYLIGVDDDNFLAHNESLSTIHSALVDNDLPQVAFFPILRHGGLFFPVGTPRMCHVDTANLVVKREIGQWPDILDYTSDGIFIERLVEEYQWMSFPTVPPIINMPSSGFCQ